MSGIKFINTQREKILRISNILIILGTCLNLSGIVGEQEPINRIIVLSYLLIISGITVVEYLIKYNNFRIMIGVRAGAAPTRSSHGVYFPTASLQIPWVNAAPHRGTIQPRFRGVLFKKRAQR